MPEPCMTPLSQRPHPGTTAASLNRLAAVPLARWPEAPRMPASTRSGLPIKPATPSPARRAQDGAR